MTDLLLLDAPVPATSSVVEGEVPGRGRSMFPDVPSDPHDPITTADDLIGRVRETVPVAVRRQLWTLFFGADDVQLPLMVPLEGVPSLPDVGALTQYGEALEAVADEFGAASVAFVLERPGSGSTTASDHAWLDGLERATVSRRFWVRPVLLCSDDGVRLLGSASRASRSPAADQASSSPVRLADIVRLP